MTSSKGRPNKGRSPKNIVSAARPESSGRGSLWAGAAVVLVLIVVIGGVVFQRSRTATVNDGYGSARTAAVAVTDGVVRVGAAAAPVTLDVYEDFLCPICSQFEQKYGQQLAQALDGGKVAVRYHTLDFLNSRSASGEYSSRAAGAALCVASDGGGSAYPAVHSALFATENQPVEQSSSDHTNAELAAIAAKAGASTAAQQCISAGSSTAAASTAATAGANALTAGGQTVSTPTILNGTTKININDTGWLTSLL